MASRSAIKGEHKALLDQLLLEAIADEVIKLDLDQKEIPNFAKNFIENSIPIFSNDIEKYIKDNLKSYIRLNKGKKFQFERRCYERWKKPIDLLEVLVHASHEVGDEINRSHGNRAHVDRDYKFLSLISLHAKAVLVAREVLCLLYGGFPDGALSRWRSLHELAVTASFLASQGQEIAHRYLESAAFLNLKAARSFNIYAKRMGDSPFSDEEMAVLEARCKSLKDKFGWEIKKEYDWASPALSKEHPTFADVERSVSLDHWRPRYRWASQHTHAGYRSPLSTLGAAEALESMHVVGQSNSGFVDPLQMTALSLSNVTAAIIGLENSVENSVYLSVFYRIAEEVGGVALKAQDVSLRKARKRAGN